MVYILKLFVYFIIFIKIEKFYYLNIIITVFIMVTIPRPAPHPDPDVVPAPRFLLVIIVCMSVMLDMNLGEIDDLLEVVQASDDPLPHDMLVLIRQPNLTEEQKRSLFRRMVAYVFRDPVGHLLNELLRLQRTVEAWQFWRNPERYHTDSLIFMVVTLAVLATHVDIDATHIIAVFQPFVEYHIQTDQRLVPLFEMLTRPAAHIYRLRWRELILEALIQLSRNLLQNRLENQASG